MNTATRRDAVFILFALMSIGGALTNRTAFGQSKLIQSPSSRAHQAGVANAFQNGVGSQAAYTEPTTRLTDSSASSPRPVRASVNMPTDPKSTTIARLSQSWTGAGESKIKLQDLPQRLSHLGLVIFLDEKAIEVGGVSKVTEITLPQNAPSLGDALQGALNAVDLTLTFKYNQFCVTIKDEADAHLYPVVYDVTGLVNSPRTLADTIQMHITPDSWEESGGVQTIELMTSNQRALLTVAAVYETHSVLQDYLDSIARITNNDLSRQNISQRSKTDRGTGNGREGSRLVSTPSTNPAIELDDFDPLSYSRPSCSNSWGNGMGRPSFRGGGMGGGGGVF